MPVHASTYLYIHIYTCTYWYIVVELWLWNFGTGTGGKPRLGGLTVEETAVRKKTGRKDQAKQSVLTCTSRRRREDGA
jgi:hypothetical protein